MLHSLVMKPARHKLRLKDAVSRVNPFIFWRRTAECVRVSGVSYHWDSAQAQMENLMSNSDLIWMRRDGIVAHHETSKPHLVSHKRRPPESGGLTLYSARYIIFPSALLNIVGSSSFSFDMGVTQRILYYLSRMHFLFALADPPPQS